MKPSASSKIKSKTQGAVIYLSQGFFNGRPTWHYLRVNKLKLPLLIENAKKGEIDVVDYGNILFSGFGQNPPDEVKDFVQKKYGTN